MEGSAVAQACFRFNVPMVECRGMSNIAGDRDKGHWQIEKAVSHCHGILLGWLRMLAG
jgi:futalosine hydrolase